MDHAARRVCPPRGGRHVRWARDRRRGRDDRVRRRGRVRGHVMARSCGARTCEEELAMMPKREGAGDVLWWIVLVLVALAAAPAFSADGPLAPERVLWADLVN